MRRACFVDAARHTDTIESFSENRPPSRRVSRGLAAGLFIGAGLLHFIRPAMYERIIPPSLPWPAALVYVSGLAEIAGGVGLLISKLRRAAGWGLVVLLIAVFPANIYMAVYADRFADLHLPVWVLWMRLPLQGLLIVWVLRVARPSAPATAAATSVVSPVSQ